MSKTSNYLLMLSMVLIVMPAQTAETAEKLNQEKFQPTRKIYSLIGMTVKTTQDQKLGTVKDLALDIENARLVEVIVSSGGFLGFDQRTVAVPPEAFIYDAKAQVLLLSNVSEEKYKAAPDFIMSKWAEHCTSIRIMEAYRYYGVTPYFAADGQGSPSGNTATEPLGYIERSSILTGLPIKNLNKETLGFVGGFYFDPLGGPVRIKHVIVRITGFLKTKRIVPPTALRFNATHDTLFLDLSEEFLNQPRFKWTYATGGACNWSQGDPGLYNNVRMQTYVNSRVSTNNGVNTRQNVQEGMVDTYTPLKQGDSFADKDITSGIYAAIRADASLSQNAQNVEVGTLNRRITLRGHVNAEEGKRVIGSIAASIGAPEDVSNLLEVRPLKLLTLK